MSSMFTWMRRLFWILALGVGIGVVVGWWRDRTAPPAPKNPPEWPPLTDASTSGVPSSMSFDAPSAPPVDAPAAVPSASPVDAPSPAPTSSHDAWVQPEVGGACPLSHPIKANGNSGIFHVPGGRFYVRTRAERCYSTPESAEADGYRRAKS